MNYITVSGLERTPSKKGIPASSYVMSLMLASILVIPIVLLSNTQVANANSIKIRENGFVVCSNRDTLLTLINMVKVGETSITDIYYKKATMQGICETLKVGEEIVIVGSDPEPEIVKIQRVLNKRTYFAGRDPMKID